MEIIKTKFDNWNEQNEIRAKREKNIELLDAKLERGKAALAVIPYRGDSYEEEAQYGSERRIVNELINEVEAMIEDEKQAIADLDVKTQEIQSSGFRAKSLN